ncbi:alpha,alpha-trehalase TreF [Fibrella aquatica]|uniref:alpha,alpha-trehalase TreF n=1 Tax=Fibrella aquatica TaxID=3242487 RepID=UPI00351FF1B7
MTSPDLLFGELFRDVQLSGHFADSKTFVDCTPKQEPKAILAAYRAERTQPGFNLGAFVDAHFNRPRAVGSGFVSDRSMDTLEHINQLWEHLTRSADKPVANSSRVALPHPYVVPGGRFREIFYWDSYFTMLGLAEDNVKPLTRTMVDNFAYLIDTVGFIPNGNRTYFLSRSQPPFFALMVNLLADVEGADVLVTYLPQLQKEHDFWMNGTGLVTKENPVHNRVARLPDGRILNRYWDDLTTPRPESYRQELEMTPYAQEHGIDPQVMYRHIRAACESGWDFTSRWLTDGHTMATICATDIVPVDLNCLLYSLEETLARAYEQAGNEAKSSQYDQLAEKRKETILDVFWNQEKGFFFDYDMRSFAQTSFMTLAGAFPLFHGIATAEQAERAHEHLKTDFLQSGGWVTTLHQTDQQWDWPNGWAPLQWIVYKGLLNYNFAETAREGSKRWLALNDKVFKATGKMMEKYNVVESSLTAGGGEYPNQDGFGWTNGVYIAMMEDQ